MKFQYLTQKFNVIQQIHDPLFQNSLYIMFTSILNAFFGFIFWAAAARLYSKEDVGITTALISSIGLIGLISRFGYDFSIIRFFPTHNKSKVISTSILITSIFSIVFGLIFVLNVDLFAPKLTLLKSHLVTVLFLLFLIANSTSTLINTSFLALRKGNSYMLQNLIISLRIFFLIPFMTLGTIGIFSAANVPFILASGVALYSFMRAGIKPMIIIDKKYLKDSFQFSAGNYIAGLLRVAPNNILPVMVLNSLGAEEAAHFFMAFTIINILHIIPTSIGTSLFVEGSNGRSMRKETIKSLVSVFLLLTLAIITLYFSAGWLLGAIGKDYVEGTLGLLRIMIFSSYPLAIVYIYLSIKRVQKDNNNIVFLSATIFILLITFNYILMPKFGLVGIGYAWNMCYFISSLIVGAMIWRDGWRI